MKPILLLLVSTLLLFACNKNNDANKNTSNGKKIFFDVWGADNNRAENYPLSSKRIAYDYENREISWVKTNENTEAFAKIVPERQQFGPKVTFTESFLVGDNLVRIYADRSITKNGPHTHSATRNAVYLEKINSKTGERIALITLLPGSVIPPGLITFDISKVVFDGSFFYFGCADGKLYCFTADGAPVWNKPNYTPLIHTYEYATLYHHAGKLFYVSAANKIVCMNAANGAELWQTYFNTALTNMQYRLELTFSNTKMFAFGNTVIFRYSLATGASEGYSRTYSDIPISPLPITNGDTTGFAYSLEENRPLESDYHCSYAPPCDLSYCTNTTAAITRECKLHNGIFYGWGFKQSNSSVPGYAMEFVSYDYDRQHINWNLKYTRTGLEDLPEIYCYFLKGERIYMLCNFYIDDKKLTIYKPIDPLLLYSPNGVYAFGAVVGFIELDALTGSVLHQTTAFADKSFAPLACYRSCVED